MRQRARTDLCGGRSAMVVPTATMTLPARRSRCSAVGSSLVTKPAFNRPLLDLHTPQVRS
jgi:hypothetical protein